MSDATIDYDSALDRRRRVLIDFIGFVCAVLVLMAALVLQDAGLISDRMGVMWFGLDQAIYPLTIQGVSWVFFAVGMAELLQRFLAARFETGLLNADIVPGDRFKYLKTDDLKTVYTSVSQLGSKHFLPRVILRVLTSYRVSGSVDQSTAVMDSTLQLLAHEVTLRYNFVRYLLWAIPSLGFIGTVMGIGAGLGVISRNPPSVENAQEVMGLVTAELAVAFDTTLVALVLTTVLAFCLYAVENREETTLNIVGQYCMDHLVNRLNARS